MKNKTVYLAGPIAGCTDEQCKVWREYIKEKLKDQPFDILDPMRRDYRGIEANSIDEIVNGDKDDIDRSDILIINFPQPSAGTCMEMIYAWERGKLIVVVVPPTATNVSPWVKYHSDTLLMSFDKAIEYVKSLL